MEKHELDNPAACLRDEFTDSELGVSLRVCYNCSTCSTSCPVALETGGKFNPRSIIQLANCGFEERLIEDLSPNTWECSMCEVCQEVCPQHVNLHEIFISVKNAAADFGNIPESYTSETNQVYLHGKAVPLQPVIAKRRAQLGLPPSPEVSISEIQHLMDLTPVKLILEHANTKSDLSEGSS
ncbi:MAG: 4Fe-4S dicluster domain-containing protein [Candidatus Lokiarchaeota archaeon]|nr:4Fe-4S dicluster domain-containing protein [Candidatus Harpocratesius repetitus]